MVPDALAAATRRNRERSVLLIGLILSLGVAYQFPQAVLCCATLG
jgi:hypothetical protein